MRTDGRSVEPALELLDRDFVHDRGRLHLQLKTGHRPERVNPVGITQELQAQSRRLVERFRQDFH